MTLKQIKAMFLQNQRWEALNTWQEKANGPRTVAKVMTTQIKWNRGGEDFWMKFPKASQVIEARDGFLSFRLYTEDDLKAAEKYRQAAEVVERKRAAVVSLTRQDVSPANAQDREDGK